MAIPLQWKSNSISNSLRIATVSDIHLGHRKNPTVDIIRNLRNEFPENEETASLDIIFFAGDVFEELLFLSHESIPEIDVWICDFLRMCKRFDICIRILEGTPSHDRRQSERFVTLNQASGIEADLRYHSTLTVDYEERFGIHVLYVPDEWGDKIADHTLSAVRELIASKGLTQVDFAVMHGLFEFQVPAAAKTIKHDSASYLEMVKYQIFIGHDHGFCQYSRIVVQGSFDRLVHGDEVAKGHVRVTVHPDERLELVFVENKNAKIFRTIDCRRLSLEDSFENIGRIADTLPNYSHVRVMAHSDNPILKAMLDLTRNHPLLYWTHIVKDPVTKEEEKDLIEEDELYIPFTITKDNIQLHLMNRIEAKVREPSVLDNCNRILLEVL